MMEVLGLERYGNRIKLITVRGVREQGRNLPDGGMQNRKANRRDPSPMNGWRSSGRSKCVSFHHEFPAARMADRRQ